MEASYKKFQKTNCSYNWKILRITFSKISITKNGSISICVWWVFFGSYIYEFMTPVILSLSHKNMMKSQVTYPLYN